VITKEKLQHRVNHLQEKHDQLDARISLDMEPEYILRVLKKEKLELKDEISTLNRRIENLDE
jgi:uncharacterized protein YdcH (DUF465 family)